MQLLATENLRGARGQLIREARGRACLICVGGDHTLSEMASVARELEVPLLPVPAGFGNILARNLDCRSTVRSILDVLERGTVRRIDAGIWGAGMFLSNQAFGFIEDVKIAVETASSLPRTSMQRYLAYVRTAARTLASLPLPALSVDADGEHIADDAVMVLVANVPTYRGFLALTPTANPFDGLLDVFVVPTMSKLRLIALFLAFFVHAPGRWRRVVCRRASRVSIRLGDGLRHDLSALPGAVPVLLSRNWDAGRHLRSESGG